MKAANGEQTAIKELAENKVLLLLILAVAISAIVQFIYKFGYVIGTFIANLIH